MCLRLGFIVPRYFPWVLVLFCQVLGGESCAVHVCMECWDRGRPVMGPGVKWGFLEGSSEARPLLNLSHRYCGWLEKGLVL